VIFPKTSSSAITSQKKVQPDEINEKISNLEQNSRAFVETIGEGVYAYWMMSKDLNKKSMTTMIDLTTLSR
jgi:hypothetical protein